MVSVAVLCGGSGSSKFVRAFSSHVRSSRLDRTYDLGFIANVGDNFWHRGLYICPDIDILTYTLAGRLDEGKGWGISSDSFVVRDELAGSGRKEWFNLGDKDMVLSLRRTHLIRIGWRLSSITSLFCKEYGITEEVLPSTDDPVETFVRTNLGNLHLQEFWVKNSASTTVEQVEYEGIQSAKANPEIIRYMESFCLICPANPITSILPTLRLPGVVEGLKKSKVIALSPFVGNKPFSGPAGALMKAMKLENSSYGVAKLYADFLDTLIVDIDEDPEVINRIRDEGIECISTKTRISSRADEASISKEIFELI